MEPAKRRTSSSATSKKEPKTRRSSRIQHAAAGSKDKAVADPSGAPPSPAEPQASVEPAYVYPQARVPSVAPGQPVVPNSTPECEQAPSSSKEVPGRAGSISAQGKASRKRSDAAEKAPTGTTEHGAWSQAPASVRSRTLPTQSTTSLAHPSRSFAFSTAVQPRSTTGPCAPCAAHETTVPDQDEKEKLLQDRVEPIATEKNTDVKRRAPAFDRDKTSSTTTSVLPVQRRPENPGIVERLLTATGFGTQAKTPTFTISFDRSARSFIKQSSIQRSHFEPAQETPRAGGKMILALVMALTLAGLVTLLIRMYWLKFIAVHHVCKTEACRAYSANLLESINKSVDPCHSFTQFVCGGWEREHLSSVRETHFLEILDKLHQIARSMDIPVKGQNEAERTAKLFLSCEDVLNGRSDHLPTIKRALESAGIVWPLQPSKVDALYTLLHSSLVLGWGSVLDFVIVRSHNENALVIKAGREFLFVIDKAFGFKAEASKVTYFEHLQRHFQREPSERGPRTVSFKETVNIENTCIGRLSKPYFTHGRDSVPSQLEDINGTRLSVDRWLDTLARLNITFPNGINLTTTSSEYLRVVLELWKELGEGSLHYFVSWCTVQVAALYANQDLISNFYDNSPTKAMVYHGAFCLSRAMSLSTHTFFSSYNVDILQSDAAKDVQTTILSVREAFRKRLFGWAHCDRDITVVSNWSSLDVVFRNFAPSNSTSTLGDLPDMSDSLVDNWRKITQLFGGASDAFGIPYVAYRLRYYLVLPEERDFQLMPYALSFPLFHDDLTLATNYGGLGAVVSRALGKLFIEAYEAAGPVTARTVDMVLDCVRDLARAEEERTVDSGAEAFGMGAIVDAYKSVASYDWPLLGMEEYSGTQLLFIALCYHKCRGSTKGNPDTVCDAPLRYLPEFATEFHCDPHASMSPLQSCGQF